MINIDQLKHNFYSEVVKYITSLCSDAEILVEGGYYTIYIFDIDKYYTIYKDCELSFCGEINILICKLIKSNNRKEAIKLYNTPQVRDMLLTHIPNKNK